jgi:hypothetical protein
VSKQFAYRKDGKSDDPLVHLDCGGIFRNHNHHCCGLVPTCNKCDLSRADSNLILCANKAEALKLKDLYALDTKELIEGDMS